MFASGDVSKLELEPQMMLLLLLLLLHFSACQKKKVDSECRQSMNFGHFN